MTIVVGITMVLAVVGVALGTIAMLQGTSDDSGLLRYQLEPSDFSPSPTYKITAPVTGTMTVYLVAVTGNLTTTTLEVRKGGTTLMTNRAPTQSHLSRTLTVPVVKDLAYTLLIADEKTTTRYGSESCLVFAPQNGELKNVNEITTTA